jgi:hypothetical protein
MTKACSHTIHPAWCAGGWWFTLVEFPLDGALVDAVSLKASTTFSSVFGGMLSRAEYAMRKECTFGKPKCPL